MPFFTPCRGDINNTTAVEDRFWEGFVERPSHIYRRKIYQKELSVEETYRRTAYLDLIWAVLAEQLFPGFSTFFPRKTGKISKVWKFNRKQNIGNAWPSNIWKKKKKKNMEIQKLREK